MKMRPPAVPLITIDPYFSVWSEADNLTDSATTHWTNKPNTINGVAIIDGVIYRFMGEGSTPTMEQTDLTIDALTTNYTFQAAGVLLTAAFFTPVFPDNYELLTRPVSYLKLSATSIDGKAHQISVCVSASEELCLNTKGEMSVITQSCSIDGVSAMRMGSEKQPVLAECGDDIRINWGYFYLCVKNGEVSVDNANGMTYLSAKADISRGDALFAFAYDDINSLIYFGKKLRSYWNRNGETIETAIEKAYAEYNSLLHLAADFSHNMTEKAIQSGGEKYAEMLSLSYRQVIAAHKLVLDEDGEILFVSKECFSNGCAATVDVSYPSIPLFLYYNLELVKGMMRPIFKYAEGGVWPFDFAPHDVGTYPHLNGQVYSNGTDLEWQMPVEECGNMLVMAAATAVAAKSANFLAPHMETLRKWADYLKLHGVDPENQLCTDDFAGHLAHNCNLSLKAVMALAGMYQICKLSGSILEGEGYLKTAKAMAANWVTMSANGDGSYRLAFDQPGTFSMKYNMIWDKVFRSDVFPAEVSTTEFASNFRHLNRYGMPLDNRADYTKSDWLVWTATFAETKEKFEEFIAPLWLAYHETASRVPMSDWYETSTAKQSGFQHRTVQGGLFMKLLHDSGKCHW